MAMTCGRLRREWEPDRPIPSWARAHAAECAACRAYMEELSRLRRALAALAEVPVPGDFSHRVRARVHASAVRAPALWPRALAVAALGAIAVALLFTVERPPEEPRTFVSSPSSAEIAPREVAPDATSREAPETMAIGKRRPVTPPARSEGSRVSRMAVRASVGLDRPPAHSDEAIVSEAFASREADPSDAPLSHDGVILLLRNEETQEESILAIPPVVFGSRLLPLRPASFAPGERRRIL